MILVTGATGSVGGATLTALAGRADAIAATRAENAGPGERRFDFADRSTYASALAGVRALFLMLPPGLADARARFREVLAVARTRGVKRVAFLSVRNADRLSILPHRGLEKEIEQSGISWTHLRPNDFMQNFASQPVYRDGIRAGRLVGPGGSSRTSYVDARDVGEAFARVLTKDGHAGRAYPLTGPTPLSLDDVADALGTALGRRIRAETPSLPRFLVHARRTGAPVPLAIVMTSIGLVARLGLADGSDPDLRGLIGRTPLSIADFARDYREVWAVSG